MTIADLAARSPDAPLIEAHELTKRYGDVLALDSLSLTLQPGVIGLVGANGAGKSTMIRILLGLLAPSAGNATLLGFDVATQGPLLRQFVGYMPEHDCLPPDVSATDFVAHMAQINGLPRAAARERTAEVLRHVGLFEERYREIGGYSTGMKQRAKLAQALVHDPRLLLLDEPTNGLDPAGRDEMLDLIRRIGTEFDISILMSSHLLGEIERVCEYLVVIDGGRLMHADSIASFTASLQILAIEVDSQTEELQRRLAARGLSVTREGAQLLLPLAGDPYDAIRDEIAAMGIGLLRLEQRRHRLEDLFQSPHRSSGRGGKLMATGNIYDLGYRPYDGERLGRRYAIASLYIYSLRAIFGLGRSPLNKLFPIGLAILALAPAAIQLAVAAIGPADFHILEPQDYFRYIEVILALLCAVATPEIIGRDQRNRTLSLYFSRALSRVDYVSAKLVALFVALFLVIVLPETLLVVGSSLSTNRVLGYLWDHIGTWPPVLGSCLGVAVMMASISLAIACNTPRRGLGTGMVIAYFVIFTALGRTLLETTTGDFRTYSLLISPLDVLEGFVFWLFGATGRDRAVAEVSLSGWVYFGAVIAYTTASLAIVYRRVLRLPV